jgi:RNA polymerase sigma factor (sigma-70 family)
MTTPPASGSNGRATTDTRANGGSADALVERELLVLAQARQLRERPAELLSALNSYISYELNRRIQQGQLDREDLLRDEVTDAAFAYALTRLSQGEPIRDVPAFLRTRAQETISREVRRILHERQRTISLEQTISSGEDGDGEEVRVADTLPDLAERDPEQIVIDNETLQFLIEALSDVPDLWRTVFLQRTMQERTAREVADLEGLDIDEVRRITIRTREYLRDRMAFDYDVVD